MAGFNYTPPRPIQYGRINPYANIAEGIATGMSLGMKKRQVEGSEGAPVPVADLKDVDIKEALPGVAKDLGKYEDEYDKFKSHQKDLKKNKDPDRIQKMNEYTKNNVSLQDPLTKLMLDKEIDPSFVNQFMDGVSGPDANNWLARMEAKLGPGGKEALQPYAAKYSKAKAAKTKEQLAEIKKGLLIYDDYGRNPENYQGSKGRVHDSMGQLVKQVNPMLEKMQELAKTDPEARKWLRDYLDGNLPQQQGESKKGGSVDKRSGYMRQYRNIVEDERYVGKPTSQEAREILDILDENPGLPISSNDRARIRVVKRRWADKKKGYTPTKKEKAQQQRHNKIRQRMK